MWDSELIIFLSRFIEKNKKIEPINTWRPWNPVAMKKLEPKAVSEIEKGAEIYSNPWKREKTPPNKIVILKEKIAILKCPFNKAWCLQVTLTPEESNKIVLRRGILMGLKGRIPVGGHICPSSIAGEILLWKKAQKKETKKNTSEIINKIIPVFKPLITKSEWCPWIEASRWISFHHIKATSDVKIKIMRRGFLRLLFIKIKPEARSLKALLDAKIGQGLTSTRWKGLNLFGI